jgi:hypothetical protein
MSMRFYRLISLNFEPWVLTGPADLLFNRIVKYHREPPVLRAHHGSCYTGLLV